MVTETCESCKRVIGELEQAYTWQSHILCKECYARLSNPTEASTVAQRPVDVHVPAIILVKSTLIVMATVIATVVALSVLAVLVDYLAIHIHQFFSTGDW